MSWQPSFGACAAVFSPLGGQTPLPAPQAAQVTPPVAATPDELLAEARAEAAAELAAERAEVAGLAHTLEAARAELAGVREQILRQAADDIAHVVVATARRVLRIGLAGNTDALATLVELAVERVGDGDEIVVTVPEAQAVAIRELIGDGPRVVGDADLDAGCRVDTRHVSIDATVDILLTELEADVEAWRQGVVS